MFKNGLRIILLILIFTSVAFASDPLLSPGKNGLPGGMSSFPEFKYSKAERIRLWLIYEQAGVDKDYIQELYRYGFLFDLGVYENGPSEVYINPAFVSFLMRYPAKPTDAAKVLLDAFPSFEAKRFGKLLGIRFEMTYKSPVPQKILQEYGDQLKKAGFVENKLVVDNKSCAFEADGAVVSWNVDFH